MISRSDVAAEYVETGSDGAVFSFRADTSTATTPEEVREISRAALNLVDIFCNRVLDGLERPLVERDGIGPLADCPYEDELMIYRYDIAQDWSQLRVIIADRYLAAAFDQVFVRSKLG
jgi:hypothetical protein